MHLLVNPPAFAFLSNLQEVVAPLVGKRGAMMFSLILNHNSRMIVVSDEGDASVEY